MQYRVPNVPARKMSGLQTITLHNYIGIVYFSNGRHGQPESVSLNSFES